MNTKRRIPFMWLAAVLVSLAVAGGVALWRAGPSVPAGNLAGSDIGGAFALIDQNGRPTTEAALRGKYALVYFGYSFCPDICPTDLQRNAQALRQFEKSAPPLAAKVLPVFITVDPERDTVAALKDYVAAFHPRLLGLTGDPAAIARAKAAYKVYATRRDTPGAAEYLMDHSSLTYLMAPNGAPITFAASTDTPAQVAALLAAHVR